MTNPQNNPQYDMWLNPAYQIEYKNVASGKIVSATKRRITWRLGFSNVEAIREGSSGSSCRGSEHEVTLTWSLTSGKREVKADGHDVHFSVGKLDVKFEASWQMRGGHILKIIAYAAPPNLLTQSVESRQYDLLLDGISFFELPHIFDLGKTVRIDSSSNRSPSTRSLPATLKNNRKRVSFSMDPVRSSSVPDMNQESKSWPINVSPQPNEGFTSAKAFDSSGFFNAPVSPTEVQNFPFSQPQTSQLNSGFYSQQKMIACNSLLIAAQPCSASSIHYRNKDPATFNVTQGNGMHCSVPQSSDIASAAGLIQASYSQNPGQRINAFFPSA